MQTRPRPIMNACIPRDTWVRDAPTHHEPMYPENTQVCDALTRPQPMSPCHTDPKQPPSMGLRTIHSSTRPGDTRVRDAQTHHEPITNPCIPGYVGWDAPAWDIFVEIA